MKTTDHTNIIDGDGSWQMRLDAGQCPKCGGSLTLNKQTGAIFCDICGLEIFDSSMLSGNISEDNKESDMETQLMPDEQSIADREPRMEWQSAVSLIEAILMDEAEDIEKGEGHYRQQDGNPELANELRAAWQRILQG